MIVCSRGFHTVLPRKRCDVAQSSPHQWLPRDRKRRIRLAVMCGGTVEDEGPYRHQVLRLPESAPPVFVGTYVYWRGWVGITAT